MGDLQLDEPARQLLVEGVAINLTGAEFNLLTLLVKAAGHVVSREQLAAEGLGRPLQAYDRRIETIWRRSDVSSARWPMVRHAFKPFAVPVTNMW